MIAWWYDPSTGVATQIGTFPGTTPQQFTPPTTGDWVLVAEVLLHLSLRQGIASILSKEKTPLKWQGLRGVR